MSPLLLPLRRPVATAMFFTALVLLGAVAFAVMPVELLPPLSGDEIRVAFSRPGSEPDLVEREILARLEAQVSRLAGVEETWGEVRGSSGTLRVRFEAGTDLKVRSLELEQLAAELARLQPEGTVIDVGSQDLSLVSRFVMILRVAGGDDLDALHRLVEHRIVPRLTAVPGVGRALVTGGRGQEMIVRLDPHRCAALGLRPDAVLTVLRREVRRLDFVGEARGPAGRTVVAVDARPRGPQELGRLRLASDRPLMLHHVADIELAPEPARTLFRVDGEAAVGLLVFQEEGANLVALGSDLRRRLQELRQEIEPYGVSLDIGFDGARLVEDQLSRLRWLAAAGFLVALAVLFGFLRQGRAVAVIAVAVPVSVLSSLALLLLLGQTLNLVTLLGLAVSFGMLVDNSIVVYEAIQRQVERGAAADPAVITGVRRTVRSILAATATNAIVFVPVFLLDFARPATRSLLEVLAWAMLLPLVASLLVAVGLVPLLARRLAVPAAQARFARLRRLGRTAERFAVGRLRGVFSGLLELGLRHPAAWLLGAAGLLAVTVAVALPWVALSTVRREAPEATELRLTVELPRTASLEASSRAFRHLEGAAAGLAGVEGTDSVIREGGGSLTVRLAPPEERPPETIAAVQTAVRSAARELVGVSVRAADDAGETEDDDRRGAALGSVPAEVILSGPDAARLADLAAEIEARIASIPQVAEAWTPGEGGRGELWAIPRRQVLDGRGLLPEDVAGILGLVRREGVELPVGVTLPGGREVPLRLRLAWEGEPSRSEMERLSLATRAGVASLGSLLELRQMPAAAPILHHNGRREMRVLYRFGSQAPRGGPARRALEERVREAVRRVHRPTGYAVELPAPEEPTDWFRRLFLPVVVLLFAVLALTFESFVIPALVLGALPLTVVGALGGLLVSGLPADFMALAGAVALLGLTVNPAILLVDRMQQRRRGGWGAGAAALLATRERLRPVWMTTATTVAGLWPLALSRGGENDLWPSFAAVVMGGLTASTLLTLLVIPVGFAVLQRLEDLLGRLGPWAVAAWLGSTAGILLLVSRGGWVTSLPWQLLTTALAGTLLLLALAAFARRGRPAPVPAGSPPRLDVRCLHKVYGQPGPVRRALQTSGRRDPGRGRERLPGLLLALAALGYLVITVSPLPWRLILLFAAAAVAAALLAEIGWKPRLGVWGAEPAWGAWLVAAAAFWAWPVSVGEPPRLPLWGVLALGLAVAMVLAGRRTAVLLARGAISAEPAEGRLPRLRTLWRRLSRRLFGPDLPGFTVRALGGVGARLDRGMIGILGPNGAGKTTFLRILAGVLEPTAGRVTLGGVPLERLGGELPRWVGYLPQDFGLPQELTVREYLDAFALLYDIQPPAQRAERVRHLLGEVGLAERSGDRIGALSGGMRQRVAVARTLLHLPPVIIVDEPTVGLDPRERIRFRNLLSRLAENRVVLFSTHVVEDVLVTCDRVLVLAAGSLVFDGRPGDLAPLADGRVWRLGLDSGEEERLPAEAVVLERRTLEDGTVAVRLLHPRRPAPEAEPVAPTIEDGYLSLLGAKAAEEER